MTVKDTLKAIYLRPCDVVEENQPLKQLLKVLRGPQPQCLCNLRLFFCFLARRIDHKGNHRKDDEEETAYNSEQNDWTGLHELLLFIMLCGE